MLTTNKLNIRDVKSTSVPSVSDGALVAALLVLNNRIPGSIDYLVRLAALINAGYDIEVLSDNPLATKQVIEEYYSYLCEIDKQIKEGKLL